MALRALPRYWAHLAGVSGGVQLHSESDVIMKIYPALSTVIGERYGMDGRRRLWMTCSINRTRHQSQRLGIVLAIGDIGLLFA